MNHFQNSDADACTELETLKRRAGQMVRQRSAATRPDDRAVIQKQLDDVQRRIRQLRSQLCP